MQSLHLVKSGVPNEEKCLQAFYSHVIIYSCLMAITSNSCFDYCYPECKCFSQLTIALYNTCGSSNLALHIWRRFFVELTEDHIFQNMRRKYSYVVVTETWYTLKMPLTDKIHLVQCCLRDEPSAMDLSI